MSNLVKKIAAFRNDKDFWSHLSPVHKKKLDAIINESELVVNRCIKHLDKDTLKTIDESSSSSPASAKGACKKLNVILDIDETLIYFIRHNLRAHSWDTLSAAEKAKYEFIETSHKDIIVIRPHLQEFLTYLFKHCNVSLWTLSEQEYAEGIAEKFVAPKGSGRKLKHIFNADDDDNHDIAASSLYGNNKDLNWLWYSYAEKYPCFSECNTILIDDLPNNALNTSNRKNSIKINPFALFGEVKKRTDPYHDVSKDDTLLRIIEILRHIKPQFIKKQCHGTEKQWSNIFSADNILELGLKDYIKTVSFKNKDIHVIALD